MFIWFPLELLSAFDHIHMLICAIERLNIIIIHHYWEVCRNRKCFVCKEGCVGGVQRKAFWSAVNCLT